MRTLWLLSLLLLAGAAVAQAQGATAAGIEACCNITVINARTGVVIARERSTGKTFRFEVKDRVLLKTLTVGEWVWADFIGKQVSVRPAEVKVCCTILPEVSP